MDCIPVVTEDSITTPVTKNTVVLKQKKTLESTYEPLKKKSKYEKRPMNNVRYDRIDHIPGVDSNSNATRCKLESCKFKTHTFCSKCEVHLCLLTDRNCYEEFHTLFSE